MDSIRIDPGLKRIAINEDPNRIIEFNPKDLLFAEKFYAMIKEIKTLLKEIENKTNDFDIRAKDISIDIDNDEFPAVIDDTIQFHKQSCEKMFEEIDKLFGTGVSEMVFQGVYDIEVVAQFLNGITPFISNVRSEKVNKYVSKRKHITRQ